ncbi:methylated-DNA--[protein]-cysteine S-methyltransferase [Candidatus Saganbacteria bacterium]|nr:methylated-DNA--[protein]-cysteine S-methyltransferase [Candidatus Saganbacteria bacterium]
MYKYSIFETKYGNMGAVASEKGLHMIILPKKKPEEVKKELEQYYTELIRDEEGLKGIGGRMREYLDGKKVKFREKMDLAGATDFELKVWDATLGIPYGETRSYAWVAKQIGEGKGVRAVGGALGRNRLPIIIPCHRVVSKEGDLGGFSAGIEMKVLLLKIEGALLC